MASKEELNSLSATAKNVCGICDKPAKIYCTDCPEFLCGDCDMKHKTKPLTKDHVITSTANMTYKPVSGNPSMHKPNSTDTNVAGDVQGQTRKLDSEECDDAREDDSNEPQIKEPQQTAEDKEVMKGMIQELSELVRTLCNLDPRNITLAAKAMKDIQQLKPEDIPLGKDAIKLAEGKYYYPTIELGRGRFSTVYKGASGTKGFLFSLAVKQIKWKVKDQGIMKELSEVRILQGLETKRNPYVVGYYELLQTASHLYIFTELFDDTLEDYVKDSYKQRRSNFSATVVNRQLAEGLRFLHAENVVHRDLKPSNIFIRLNEKRHEIERVVIGDFGSAKLCRMQFKDAASLSIDTAVGTEGYLAPEVYEWFQMGEDMVEYEKRYYTFKADTFSLGLIFYFTISNGKHPFGNGQWHTVQHRIQERKEPNLEEANIEYRYLIRQMIKTDSTERMSAEAVLNHPALWTSERTLNYFKGKSDFLVDSESPMVDVLKGKLKSSEIVQSRGWMAELPTSLKDRLCGDRNKGRYNENSVTALLRAIRNTENHIDNYPELSGGPDHRLTIWKSACPELTMCVYDAFKEFDNGDLTDSQELNQAPIDKDTEQTEVLNAVNRSQDDKDCEQTEVLKQLAKSCAK